MNDTPRYRIIQSSRFAAARRRPAIAVRVARILAANVVYLERRRETAPQYAATYEQLIQLELDNLGFVARLALRGAL